MSKKMIASMWLWKKEEKKSKYKYKYQFFPVFHFILHFIFIWKMLSSLSSDSCCRDLLNKVRGTSYQVESEKGSWDGLLKCPHYHYSAIIHSFPLSSRCHTLLCKLMGKPPLSHIAHIHVTFLIHFSVRMGKNKKKY